MTRGIGVWLRRFALFWWDFVVGDDWRVAFGVALGLAVTYGVSRTAVPAWWVLPLVVVLVVAASLWRATRRARRLEP